LILSVTKQQVKALLITLQLGLWAAADGVEYYLSFATWTLDCHCKAPHFMAGCDKSLGGLKAAY